MNEAKHNFIKVQILENKEDPKSLWKVFLIDSNQLVNQNVLYQREV